MLIISLCLGLGVLFGLLCYWIGCRHGYEEGYEDAMYDYPEE